MKKRLMQSRTDAPPAKRGKVASGSSSAASSSSARPRLSRSLSAPTGGPTAPPSTGQIQAHEESQISQLRSAFRGKKLIISELKRKLHEEHKLRSLSESTLSCVSRHWDQLESALIDLQKRVVVPKESSENSNEGSGKGLFETAVSEINEALNADVTYRRNRTVRIDTLLDDPFEASDDEDDEDGDGAMGAEKALALAEERFLTKSIAPVAEKRVAWAKTLLAGILSHMTGKGKMSSDAAAVLDKQKAEARLRGIAESSLVLTRSLESQSQKLEEQTYLNENILRRLEKLRSGKKKDDNGESSDSAKGADSSGSSSSKYGGGSESETTSSEVKKESDALKLQIQELTSKLELLEQQNESRLSELSSSLKEKKRIAAKLSKYEAGDIPKDVLHRVGSYVAMSKENAKASDKISAISAREAAANARVEELKAEQKKQSLQMNSQMHNLKNKCESQVRALMVEMGRLAKYGDELKIQLKIQQRESTKIGEGEARESELQNIIAVQKAEIERMRKSQLEKVLSADGHTDLKKQLTVEIEKLGEAFGKLQNQNANLVKQLKRAKQQVHDKSKDVETNRQRANLSQQNAQAVKSESERRARAEAHTSNYAKSQEAALKKSNLLVDQLRKENANLELELKAARSGQSVISPEKMAFANIQKANAEKAEQLSKLQDQIADLEYAAKRRTEELKSVQRDLKLKTRQISEAGGDVGRLEVKEVRELYAEMEDSLRCPVNPNRWKNCIIGKCFHMFNNESLLENLAKRNRKCPTCNLKYDKPDIVKVPLYDPLI